MNADSSFQILVIVLSVILAICLILGLVVLIKIIQILQYIKHIMEKADALVDKAGNVATKIESVAEVFHKTAAPLALGRVLTNIADTFLNRNNTKKTGRKNNGDG